MTQTIEQLTARVRELEKEKKELQALLDFDNARLDQIEDELEDVEYLGPYVEGIKVLKTQLAKAEQLWQVAQGRCDGLEEKLAKAEQRVAEWQPIETAPVLSNVLAARLDYGQVCWVTDARKSKVGFWSTINGRAVDEPTHWMPLPKVPKGASS